MKILTFNLGLLCLTFAHRHVLKLSPHLDARLAAAPDLLAGLDADVIVLQEVFGAKHQARLIADLADTYPHSAGTPNDGLFAGSGLVVLSRHPLGAVRFHRYKDQDLLHSFWQQGFQFVTIECPDLGPLRLANVHLSISAGLRHPGSAASMACRRREMAALLTACKEFGSIDLLLGDFNCGPNYSRANYDELLASGFVDGFVAANGTGCEARGNTWSAANPVVAAGRYRGLPDQRVDHLLLAKAALARLQVKSAELVLDQPAVSTRSGPVTLSDHYGMMFHLGPAAAQVQAA